MRYLLLFMALVMTGCASGGTSRALYVETEANGQVDAEPTTIVTDGATITIPAGYNVKVSTADAHQPTPPDEAAVASVSDKGADADSGNGGKTAGALGLAGTLWIGIFLVIIGGIIWLSKRKGLGVLASVGPTGAIALACARLPKGAGILIMILGGTVIVLPWFLDTIEPLVVPVVCIVLFGFGGWWVYNMIDDKGKPHADEG